MMIIAALIIFSVSISMCLLLVSLMGDASLWPLLFLLLLIMWIWWLG